MAKGGVAAVGFALRLAASATSGPRHEQGAQPANKQAASLRKQSRQVYPSIQCVGPHSGMLRQQGNIQPHQPIDQCDYVANETNRPKL